MINTNSLNTSSFYFARNARTAVFVAATVLSMAACGSNKSNAPAGGSSTQTDTPTATTAPAIDTTTTSGPTAAPATAPAVSTPGGGQVTATDAGTTLQLSHALFYTNSSDTTGAKKFAVTLSSYDYCAWASAHDPSLYPKTTFGSLGIYLVDSDGATATALKPGTYTVGAGSAMAIDPANSGYSGASVACVAPWPQIASGTVTIASVADKVVTGSVDLTLKDNDGVGTGTIKGAFTTTPCLTAGTGAVPATDPEACPKK